ncbi:MAG: DUF1549 and DUF1553 domain-containing protein [Pirellulaceae bacterium]
MIRQHAPFGALLRNPIVALGIVISLLAGDANAADRSVRIPRRTKVVVTPERVNLHGVRDTRQLLVTGVMADGSEIDLTHLAEYTSNTSACHITENGLVTVRGNGSGSLMVKVGHRQMSIAASVKLAEVEQPVSFKHEIVPLLSLNGCSDIRCHGAPSGKGGFRLSLWGSDESFDFEQLVRDAFGRRTNAVDPENSLVLQKPLARVSHIGGQRFAEGSLTATLLRAWQEQGLINDLDASSVKSLSVTPGARVLHAPATTQQLVVTAEFEDGTSADVSQLATFSSSDLALATVETGGKVSFSQQGEVAILCRYMGEMVSARMMHIAEASRDYQWSDPEPNNFIDEYVYEKLEQLHITPSDVCTDEEFVRRVYLDLCGVLPSPEETTQFINSESANKRAGLIDALMQREEFSDLWTKKWMDVFRVSRDSIQLQGAQTFQGWLREQVVADRPFSDVVSDMLTATGDSYSAGASNYFCAAPMERKVTDPDYFQKDLAESTAQLFMGIRLQCAQCHNHPYERWTQDDYLGLAAFFSQVTRSRLGKAGPDGRPERRQISVALDTSITTLLGAEHKQVKPHFPGESPLTIEDGSDYRKVLSDWLVADENPFFAKSVANRIWFHLNGRGIVEPVDDFRDSNPSANDPLLESLASHFSENEFRLRPLIRAIVLSKTYQASSSGNATNASDNKYFSHQTARPLPAEVLLDAICEVTGVPEQYEVMEDYTIGIPKEKIKMPLGTRAVQLPVTDVVTLINTSSSYVRYELHPFLRTFGQPVRRQTCECDRSPGFSRKQALELTVGEMVSGKVANPTGRIKTLIDRGASDQEIMAEFYTRALSRVPDTAASQKLLDYIASSDDRQQAWEDILWTILNSKEFIYQH